MEIKEEIAKRALEKRGREEFEFHEGCHPPAREAKVEKRLKLIIHLEVDETAVAAFTKYLTNAIDKGQLKGKLAVEKDRLIMAF